MTNLWEAANNNIALKVWGNGLHSFAQANCQVTLTDEGYHIYRPPNKNPTDDGSTMWGGLCWRDPNGVTGQSSVLQENHNYVIYIDMHGKTNNRFNGYVGWTNNLGWHGEPYGLGNAGLTYNGTITNNFNGYITMMFKFTATDIMKTCTKSYSSFTQGTEYNTYHDFGLTFNYEDTGDWGTDLYITGIRLYDLAEVPEENLNITHSGIVTYKNMIEVPHNQHTVRKEYLQSDNFTER